MFYHAFDGYMHHAFPLDELRPLTCKGEDTLGGYALTLVRTSSITKFIMFDNGQYNDFINFFSFVIIYALTRLTPWIHWPY